MKLSLFGRLCSNKMKLVTQIVIILLTLCSCASEAKLFEIDNSKVGVNYKSSRGTIFNQNYPFSDFFVIDVDSTTHWMPKNEDIELAEEILSSKIEEVNKSEINQMEGCPVIHKNLYSYFRQYVGITNDKGQRLIHINFYWDKFGLIDRIKGYADRRLDYNSNYAVVFDGCSHYWQVNVNLEEKKLSDFLINGYA